MERRFCNEPMSVVKLVVCVVIDRVAVGDAVRSPSDLVSIAANQVEFF